MFYQNMHICALKQERTGNTLVNLDFWHLPSANEKGRIEKKKERERGRKKYCPDALNCSVG